jgi:transcriptional regulator with XRE-family HTH domain
MSGNDTLSPEQSRAARRLLNWSLIRLGCRTNASETTISKFEEGLCVPSVDKLAAIRAALEAAGVEFIEENGGGPSVRLRNASP